MRKTATALVTAGFVASVPATFLTILHWPGAVSMQFLAGILIIIGVILIFINIIARSKSGC